MKFKGTKGNWELIAGYDEKYNQPILDVGNASICTIWSGVDKGDELPHEVKANALLISKAPEMLEIINELLKELRYHGFNNSTAICNAEQLIKSATEIN